ncbi:MAG: ABC transporter ATP-binding protein [Bacillota bacterium]
MAQLRFSELKKVYEGDVLAVDDFNLHVDDDEFIVLVGPSGCGKSTTLRMVAGLEDITDGDLYIDDVRVNDVQPKDRDIAMVFQSYALYPHMTVYDNMAFSLKLRKFPKDDIDERVKEAAKILGLEAYLDRKPKALSGGQKQRVALGRAIVRDANVFLMDEPLSNLDAKLRVQMRAEIIKLHKRIKTTTIYVTHDQIEAMTMADRIVIMNDGYIQQVGVPKEIYDYPNNVFVGGFIGTPAMNFVHGKLKDDGFFESENVRVKVPQGKLKVLKDKGYEGQPLIMGIRPEDIHDENIVLETYKDSHVKLKVEVSELLGAETNIYAKIGDKEIVARVTARDDIKMGDELELAFDMNKVHFFDPESELRIRDDKDKTGLVDKQNKRK